MSSSDSRKPYMASTRAIHARVKRKLISDAEPVLVAFCRAPGFVVSPIICSVATSTTICRCKSNRYSIPSAAPKVSRPVSSSLGNPYRPSVSKSMPVFLSMPAAPAAPARDCGLSIPTQAFRYGISVTPKFYQTLKPICEPGEQLPADRTEWLGTGRSNIRRETLHAPRSRHPVLR